MAERRRERRREQKEPPAPRKEQRKDKQTKFVIAAQDLDATPEQLETIKGTLLKNAVNALKDFKTVEGQAIARPDVAVEFFSLSFSLSFSLGIGEPDRLAGPTR